MPQSKLKVIVTRKLPEPVETRMAELFDTELNATDTPMTYEQLVDAVSRADVLVPTVTDKIDSKVLSRAGERLRLIAQFGAGVDNMDVATAIQRGITVTNTPGVLTEDTADITMALILAVPRRLMEGVRVVEADGFEGWSPRGCWAAGLLVSVWALSAWAALAKRWRAAPRPLACKSITTIAAAFRPR